jgi:outer membrane beta-barrel protein
VTTTYKTLKLSTCLSVGAAFVCGAGMFLLLPNEAQARKPGVLEGKPVVVDRLELRKFRAQITPMVGMSLSQPFVHKGFAGANVRFDFTDWIGIRASFMYGVLDVETKLLKALNDGGLPVGIDASNGEVEDATGFGPYRPIGELDTPAPLRHDFRAGLTKLQFMSSFDVAFTPFSGKTGLFSAIFTEWDIYVFGGVGVVRYVRHYPDEFSTSEMLSIPNSTNTEAMGYCDDPVTMAPNSECLLHPVKADSGVRVGGSFGAGLHLFITDWLSINPEIHDIVVGHNDAGLNATITDVPPRVNNVVSGGDRVVRHNVTFNLGLTFYLPPKAKRSRLEQKLRRGK